MSAKKLSHKNSILILGVGNLLRKDDGIAIHIIRELEKLPLAKEIKLIDGGTGGLNLFDSITAFKKVIIIDAMQMEGRPGKIRRVELPKLKFLPNDIEYSLHEGNFTSALKLASSLGKCPQVIIFGIKPCQIGPELGLTPKLRAIIPSAVRQILAEVKQANGGSGASI